MKKITILILLTIGMINSNKSQTPAFDTINTNNIQAVFNCSGSQFSDYGNSFFEAPKGSNNKTILSNILWVAGELVPSDLRLAGGLKGSSGTDYYPGPLSINGTLYTNSTIMSQWNRVWKITKSEIDYHRAHFNDVGYVPLIKISSWPGNGDATFNQEHNLAPYYDLNNDNIYNPLFGDYPLIPGDEALFFIFNDVGGPHTATNSNNLGIEVHALIYAFNCPQDSALNNSIFVKYRIFNRSLNQYTESNLGLYSNMGIGNINDNFIQSDILNASCFVYSASVSNSVNGSYPVQGVTILSGPYMDSDGLDDPKYDQYNNLICGNMINGANFTDGCIDNERYGATGFICFGDNFINPYCNNPTMPIEYNNYLKSKWRDGHNLLFGGNGYDSSSIVGPKSKFMYPANSDPCHWSTEEILPNGNSDWREENSSSISGERQGLLSSGAFTIQPGAYNDIDFALIFSCDYGGDINSSILKFKDYSTTLKQYFSANSIPCGGSFNYSQISNVQSVNLSYDLYPNPSIDFINISGKNISSLNFEIYNTSGSLIKSGRFNSDKNTIEINDLFKGFYLIRIFNNSSSMIKIFIKN